MTDQNVDGAVVARTTINGHVVEHGSEQGEEVLFIDGAPAKFVHDAQGYAVLDEVAEYYPTLPDAAKAYLSAQVQELDGKKQHSEIWTQVVSGLVAGGVIGIALFLIAWFVERPADQRFQEELLQTETELADRSALLLTLNSNENLDGVDLTGRDLASVYLKNKSMVDAVLVDATLANANLSEVDLSNADLTGADLSGADLSVATLSNAEGGGATFDGATLFRAVLDGADLKDAALVGAVLNRAVLDSAELDRADLTNADLRDASLVGTDLSNADLRGADFGGADLTHAKLRCARHDGTTEWPDGFKRPSFLESGTLCD